MDGASVTVQLEECPDEQLVLLARQGHDSATAVLVERYRRRFQDALAGKSYPRVLRMLEAQEVLQDAFLSAFERLDEFVDAGSGSFARWVEELVARRIVHTVRRVAGTGKPPVLTYRPHRHF